jgi:hypothetical protein
MPRWQPIPCGTVADQRLSSTGTPNHLIARARRNSPSGLRWPTPTRAVAADRLVLILVNERDLRRKSPKRRAINNIDRLLFVVQRPSVYVIEGRRLS